MPKILVLQGPDAGKTFDVGRNAIVGRAPRVHVKLTDPRLSKWHFQIHRLDDGYLVEELFGRRPVSVGGDVVSGKSPLRHGDVIQVADTVLLFSEDETLDVPEDLLEDEAAALARNTLYRGKMRSTEMELADLAGTPAHHERLMRQVLHFSRMIGSLDEEPRIFEAVLDFIFEAFRADRATILLLAERRDRFRIVARRQRQPLAGELRATTSRAIVREVYRTQDHLLLADAQDDARFDASQSVSDQHIRAVMAVPMVHKDEFLGAVVVDSTTRKGAFAKEDLNLLGVLALHAATAIERARLSEEVKVKILLEHEIELAGSIQQRILPEELPHRKDVELFGTMIPAQGVGGDYYDFLEEGDDLYLAIGDVAGKGINAGLVMMMARTYFRSLVEVYEDPGDIVTRLDGLVARDTAANYFMSFLLAKWRPGGDRLAVCGAGHEHILRYAKDTHDVSAHPAGGMVLGIASGQGSPREVQTIPFRVGDVILLYSDGVTEAQDEEGRMFGLARLLDAFGRSAGNSLKTLVNDLLEEVQDFTLSHPQHDDITLLAARRLK